MAVGSLPFKSQGSRDLSPCLAASCKEQHTGAIFCQDSDGRAVLTFADPPDGVPAKALLARYTWHRSGH